MYAIILAGGEGTRLRPYTNDRPKPMVEVGGKPILEHIILQLKRGGISDVVIPGGRNYHVIGNYFRDGQNWGVNVYHMEDIGTDGGTLGAIRAGVENIPNIEEDAIVWFGDILSNLNVAKLLERHKANKEKGVKVTLVGEPFLIPLGVMKVNESGVINRFWQNTQHFIQI